MMVRTLKRTNAPAVHFFLAQATVFAYNCTQQHPPRLSTMRTMGGYFFPGWKMKFNKRPFTHEQQLDQLIQRGLPSKTPGVSTTR